MKWRIGKQAKWTIILNEVIYVKRIAMFILIVVVLMPCALAQSPYDASFEAYLHLTYSENLLSPSADDEAVKNTLFFYADTMRAVSYNQVIAHLDELGIEYEGEIGENILSEIHVDLAEGSLYFCFFPIDLSDTSTEFGDPEKEMLKTVEYERDEKWISIDGSFQPGRVLYEVGDKSADPITHYVSSIMSLCQFYNSHIGGFITINDETS